MTLTNDAKWLPWCLIRETSLGSRPWTVNLATMISFLPRLVCLVAACVGLLSGLLAEDSKAVHAVTSQRIRDNSQVLQKMTTESANRRLLIAGKTSQERLEAANEQARALGVPLQRIELSAVAGKYLGETEKNLEKVLAKAEAAGALLFFDEADALFGKRTELRDSNDRYANQEVAYVLQKLEASKANVVIGTTRETKTIDPTILARWKVIPPKP